VALAGELAGRGHETHLFARAAPFALEDRDGGVRLHTLQHDAPLNPGLDVNWSDEDLVALTELIAGYELDVLHYHYAAPFAGVARAVGRRLGGAGPVIVGTLHGTDVSTYGRRPASRRALREALAAADALTAPSHNHALLAKRLFDLARPPIVVPNFIDLERFMPEPVVSRAAPRIAHVSNFRQVKRPVAMARIFAAVSQRTGAELWLVGDGDGLKSVEAILTQEGVERRVRHFGLRLDLEAILPQADVLLVTSHTESFCLAALEAAACGLPVVAPRVGGLPEVVIDGVTGLLYPRAENLAAEHALMSILGDDALRSRMGKAARARAADLANDAVVPQYVSLYADLLADADLPRRSTTSAGRLG
jgi:N-acetyl-alpha-D-glucosaminyl L-malate synthase BshA